MAKSKLEFIKEYSSKYYKMGIVLVALVIFTAFMFTVNIKDLLRKEVELTLSEVATQGAAVIDEKIANTLDSIASIATLDIISNPKVAIKDKVNKLQPEVVRKGFLRMGIADLNGDTITTDGFTVNISHRDYFKKSLRGKPTLSDVLTDLANDNERIIVYSVPILKDKEIVGVLFAVDEKEKLAQLLEQIYYSGKANSYFIDSNMEVLMVSNQSNISEYINLFSVIKDYPAGSTVELKDNIAKQKNGVGSYRYREESKFVGYTRLKNTDNWYLMVAAPENVVLERANKINDLAMLLLASFSLVFIFLIYHTNKMNTQFTQELKANEERYRIINEHTNDIIIDWDLKNKLIYTTSAWKDIFGFELDYISKENYHLKNIHPEDNRLVEECIELLFAGVCPLPIEIRLKNKNGNYIWFNSTMVGIFDEQTPIRVISVLKDINEVKIRQELLRAKAEYDSLSKLFNRATFEENAKEEIRIAKILNKRLAFIFVDIDDFRFFNNNYGHAFGDRVISFIGNNLKKHAEDKGFAGRNGGDEFIICITQDSTVDDIENFVKALMEDLKKGMAVREGDHSISIGCSIGIVFYPELADNYEELIKNADEGMYHAKKSGKGTYTILNREGGIKA